MLSWNKNKNKLNQESLWLDENNPISATKIASRVIQNEGFQVKLFKLMQHFDSSSTTGSKKKNSSTLKISKPMSFTHVSHVDTEYNFGINDSFNNVNTEIFDNLLPVRTAPSINRRSVSTSVASLRQNNDISYQSTLDPINIKAVSSYRTSPTPVKPPLNLSSHKRSSSCATSFNVSSSHYSGDSTITPSNSFRMSLNSETSLNSPITANSFSNEFTKLPILPCIPQNQNENDTLNDNSTKDYDDDLLYISSGLNDKFKFIPTAPPPPPTKIAPAETLKSIIQSREEIEIATDSDDDDDGDIDESEFNGVSNLKKISKFRLSKNIESITNEIQVQLGKKFDNSVIMTQKCRNSIIQLLKDDDISNTDFDSGHNEEFLMNLLDRTQLSLHQSIPKLNHRDTNVLMSDIKEEEEEEEDEEEEGEGTGKADEKEQINGDITSIMDSLNFGDNDSIIDTTFNLEQVDNDFFGDLQISDSLSLDMEDV